MYCGHEYTAANLRFALTVEPANAAALEYRDRVARLRAADAPSLPSHLCAGNPVNPFLRCDSRRCAPPRKPTPAGRCPSRPKFSRVLRAWKDQFR